MTGMLLSKKFMASAGEALGATAKRAGISPEIVDLPADGTPLPAADCARIEVAFLTRDIRFSPLYKTFGDAMVAAKNLKWVH